MLDRLIDSLADPDNREYGETLAQIKALGPTVVPKLVTMLDNLDNLGGYKAFTIIHLLSEIGGSSAVEALYKVLLYHQSHSEEYSGLNDEAGEALVALNALKLDRLIPYLQHDDPVVRSRAAFYLHWLRTSDNDGSIVDALIPLANDSSEDVRNATARSLGQLGDPRAAEALITILRKATTGRHRFCALLALKAVPDRRAVEVILPLLEDEDDSVCTGAANALGAIGDGRALESLFAMMQRDYERGYASGALSQLENIADAADRLLAIVSDNNQPDALRCRVSEVLGHTKDFRAVAPLVALLFHENLHLRNSAIWGLTRLGYSEAAPALIHCLEDEDDWVRSSAIIAFEHIKSVDAVEPLLRMLHMERDYLRCLYLVQSLRHQADPRAVEPLRNLLVHLESSGPPTPHQVIEEAHLALYELTGDEKWRASIVDSPSLRD